MDINLGSQVPIQQKNQASQQAQNNATTQSGATSTVQNVPDNVVTAATNSAETSTREGDTTRRRERSAREQNLVSIQDLQIKGFSTRVEFDHTRDRVFLEILLPKSGEVIQRIPSESLIDFFQSQVDANRAGSSVGNLALDQSI